jgi:hypothetical protein
MSATITFTSDGTGHCLYTEAIQLGTIGALDIKRATNIEFNGITQRWEVRDAKDNCLLFQDASREICLHWEHENLQ